MTAPLYNLGHFCVRHKFIVIAVWLVAFIALAAVSVTLGQNTSDNLTLPGTDSQKATRPARQEVPRAGQRHRPVVFVAPHGHKLDESTYEDAIKQVNDDYKNDKHAVRRRGQPLRLRRRGPAVEGQDRRLHLAHAEAEPERDGREGRAGHPRRRQPGQDARHAGLGRRLRRPEAVQALDPPVRGRRARGRGHHPPLHLRDASWPWGCRSSRRSSRSSPA